MPAFDFSLGFWVELRAAFMRHFLPSQPIIQIARDVAGAVIIEQTRLEAHDGVVATKLRQRQFDRVCHVMSAHVGAEIPGDDLEKGEFSLQHFIDGGGFVHELVGRFDHHIIGCSDEVGYIENAVSK